ncbi:MAG: DUF1153 domain-containing protein [Planctomycetota bacterium]|jgi:transposase-like protein
MSKEEVDVRRWTAKRKAAVVLGVLRNQRTVVEAYRRHGLKQPDPEVWTQEFLGGGSRAFGLADGLA